MIDLLQLIAQRPSLFPYSLPKLIKPSQPMLQESSTLMILDLRFIQQSLSLGQFLFHLTALGQHNTSLIHLGTQPGVLCFALLLPYQPGRFFFLSPQFFTIDHFLPLRQFCFEAIKSQDLPEPPEMPQLEMQLDPDETEAPDLDESESGET